MKKPIIHLYTLCYNEEKILPYFLRHYLNFVEKITIFDNQSTDASAEIAKSFDKVIWRKFNSHNQLNDNIFLKIKNLSWKESRGEADFVIVCDMDEFLHHPNILELLTKLKGENYTLATPTGFNMVSKNLPSTEGQIYEEIKWGIRSTWSDKTILFNPNKIEEIKYEPGCHQCNPIGEIKVYRDDDQLKLLHYKYLDIERLIKKNEEYAKRLSAVNKKLGWGNHYLKTAEAERLNFQKMLQEKKLIIK